MKCKHCGEYILRSPITYQWSHSETGDTHCNTRAEPQEET